MKTPHLLASFAVAATASAADLKHPDEVAREWNESVAASTPVTGNLSLLEPSKSPLRIVGPSPARPARDKSKDLIAAPQWGPIPRERIYDAPNYRVPEVLPDNMPPGAKAWEYGGQTYWLIPLIPSREK
jgi:hypothetical protein